MLRWIEHLAGRSMTMSDEVWRRHANPWSVWTRVVVLPLLVLAVWSRVWIGWWALVPVGVVVVWTWLNPRVFPEPGSTESWASRVVLGEHIWLHRGVRPVPDRHQLAPTLLLWVSIAGLPFLVWGLWVLAVWPTALGLVLVMLGKLWFADRMVWLYEDTRGSHPPGPPDASAPGRTDARPPDADRHRGE